MKLSLEQKKKSIRQGTTELREHEQAELPVRPLKMDVLIKSLRLLIRLFATREHSGLPKGRQH